jgi:aryl-alcohol dehydrogenase-like predicted oxidoreductase
MSGCGGTWKAKQASRNCQGKEVAQLAQELGYSVAQVAIAWCLKNPHVSTVITGASRPEQVRENMKALEAAMKLTPEVMECIEGILENKPEPEPDDR